MYAVDPTRIEQSLGWQPAWSLGHGLAATVDWYLDHTDWWQPRVHHAQPYQTMRSAAE
jgi:dTDP-glucose 4,6-dehydratase